MSRASPWWRWALLAAVTAAAAASGRGEPMVVGFDRFHAQGTAIDGGRLLYNELGCANCHGGDTGLPARRGPELATVTTRATAEWLQAFIADPSRHRAGTSMPHLFAAREAADVDAVVHYLGTLGSKTPPRPKVLRHINTDLGRELFHTKGCVACHAPRADYAPPEGRPAATEFTHASVALPELKEKYVLATLAEVIRDPLKTRPDGRMPRIELEEQDAVDIAGYLLGLSGSDGEAVPKLRPFLSNAAKAERGRAIVKTFRCAACHDLPAAVAVTTIPLQAFTGGCLGETPAAGLPRYPLSAAQRRALAAYLERRDEPLAAALRASLTLAALNCAACHERDGRGGPDGARRAYFLGDHNLGDTGRLPPPLTGAGRKLQPDWLAQTLKGSARVRPYLQTRMPVYGNAVAALPALLHESDARSERALPPGDIEAGRKLLGTQGGVSCITCHRWSDRASLGIQALDLSTMAKRLEPGWLREYLVNPAAYRPGTLMPSFWPEGKASNHAILGGDTDRQIASIFAFARSGRGLPEGIPEAASREFELTPRDRPIVMRTFLQQAGTHAILVGFPAGVHLAYDGREARPAIAWKGRFFDAYSTWFVRAAPFEKPLGDAIVSWPAPAAAEGTRRFEGYRLDAAGVPTFLFSVDGVVVEDRIEATATGLRRTLRWNVEALRSLPVSHPSGVTVSEAAGSEAGKLSYLYTW
ncbi:c-type cytochrome [Horticoccus sp. 23ND18S-11]|uniref:c-type cytochrome n=1 Tax=Horticoccus sp. 23ND18S-11 TaxID=3391832 RepID=UPI0039C9D007